MFNEFVLKQTFTIFEKPLQKVILQCLEAPFQRKLMIFVMTP